MTNVYLTTIAASSSTGPSLKSVLTVSTLLEGEYGQEDVCLSIPCTISQKGVERIVMAKLSGEELDAMSKSGAVLRNALSELQKKG